jgi:3-phenylpropionate/cinnamic acid dioxygenase small subunit
MTDRVTEQVAGELLDVDEGWSEPDGGIHLPSRREALEDPERAAERFIIAEAALLDADRLEDWWGLFSEDALYWLPMSRSATRPTAQLNLIFDDKRLLGDRVFRIRTGDAHTQDPPSQLTRAVCGVRADAADLQAVDVRSTVIITEFRSGVAAVYPVRCTHGLRLTDDGFVIVRKRVDLAIASAVLPSLTFLL